MHQSLIAYIKDHSTTPLTETDIAVIEEVFAPKKIRKHQYFLQEGEVCKYAAFIVNGAMRWSCLYFRCDLSIQAIFSCVSINPVIKSLVPASFNSPANLLMFSLSLVTMLS